uniref:Uncharacterized protein n=1 Tax=Amphora coffeiformis TaxID=265554 RepID=A0A7S3P4I1_9STRA|mmetsp:Transcript_15588/g.29770  ORF Transcript_15588/g.29770 Transcript_15588/m.29770 type:complete len:331 (+) Transcript_15588:214-1206(+)
MGNKVSNNAGTCISPHYRTKRIRGSAEVLYRHLQEDTPIVLPPDLRWAIAEETRHCFTKCKACNTYQDAFCRHIIISQNQCNGTQLFEDLRSAAHSFSENLPFKITGSTSWPRVRNIVHSIVQHQLRLDAKWYRRTLMELDNYTSLIPKRFEGEQRERLCATLFIEILTVVASSHMLHIALLCLGDHAMTPIPKPPSHDPKLHPSYLDIQTAGMLKRNHTLRINASVAHAPYILSKDYDRTSGAWAALGSDVQEYLLNSMNSIHPFVSLGIAPLSLYLCASMAGQISMPDRVLLRPWKQLDPTQYCTDGFTRHDCETLMVATAEAYGTGY